MAKFIIRKAELQDLDYFLSLAKDEGWNPGLHDALPFYSTDPNGLFIGELDGKKIGCISAVAYNTEFGFMGFYIILPEYRGMGWGLQLWDHAVAYLGKRSIGLDGVIGQQENYKKSGFGLYYKNIRFEGRGHTRPMRALTDLRSVFFDELLEYDLPIFGLSRKTFLKHWIEMPNSCSFGKIVNSRLKGYGVIRSCVNGYKIGPLFADNLEIAVEIYEGLCSKAGDNPVFLDIPEVNPLAVQLAESAGLKVVFETARMYNHTPPNQLLEKVFGITSFELG